MRGIWMRRGVAMSICALATVALPGTAYAATVPVPCNAMALKNAITAANANPGPDTLNLAPGCLYLLDNTTGPLPSVTDPLTIHGNVSRIQRDVAAAPFRIFSVNSTLNLDNITLTGGDATGDFGGAVAVFSPGALNLTNGIIFNNTADFSGGIGGLAGTTINIINSLITGNSVTVNGGGLFTDGTMNVTNTVIRSNSAGNLGGGVANSGVLHLLNTVINSNRAPGLSGKGGGIANVLPGVATLTNSVVTGNSSTLPPGGIDNEGVSVSLIRSVVVVNSPTNCSPTSVPGCVN